MSNKPNERQIVVVTPPGPAPEPPVKSRFEHLM